MNIKIVLILSILVIIFAVVFYPTLWTYSATTIGGNTYPVRINRVTGYAEYFAAGLWIGTDQKEANRKSQLFPPIEQAKVQLDTFPYILSLAELKNRSLEPEVYNGSSWTITEVVIKVSPTARNGDLIWDRQFKAYCNISPLSSAEINFNVSAAPGAFLTGWKVIEIRGHPPN